MRARWLNGEELGGRLCDAFYQNLPLYNFSIKKQELNNVVNLHFINDKCKYRINKVEMGMPVRIYPGAKLLKQDE